MFHVCPPHGADPAVQQPAMHEALFWAKFLQFGVIFLPISLFHLGLLIARVRPGRMVPLLYALHVILALTNFSSFFVKDVKNVKYAWSSVGGPGFWVFLHTASVFLSSGHR